MHRFHSVVLVAMCCLVGACLARKHSAVDPTLPESTEPVERAAPQTLLDESAGLDEPSVRGRALELLILYGSAPAGGSFGQRGLRDPDPWVQHRAVIALSSRLPEKETVALLSDYLARQDSMVNPYAQGAAGVRLIDAGLEDAVQPYREAYARLTARPWDAAPLALVGAKLGDPNALKVLKDVLSRADLPLEIEFIVDIARSGLVSLAPALEAGQDLVEEEMALAFALGRLSLGDAGGEHILRGALNSDDEGVRMEALDLLARAQGTDSLLQKAASQKRRVTHWYAELALVVRGKRSAESLEKGVLHEHRMVREYAVRFAGQVIPDLGKKANRIARNVVKLGLKDPDPIVRLESLKSAVLLNLQPVKEDAQSLLVDEVRAVRVEAAGTLLALQLRN